MGDFFNSVINVLFRSVPDVAKGFIIAACLLLTFWFLAKTLRLGKQGGDKKPFHIGYFLTALLFLAIAILYITI
ncbi:MAG: hypothetical protein FWE53_01810 [Firmicutes bacterium]|nr:hypothetical protein [Bacillota bacterium]